MKSWWRTDEELMQSWWRADEELIKRLWRADVELMQSWWRIDKELTKNWWTADEQLMNWWWTDDELMMNWWWNDDELIWSAKDYHRLSQTTTDCNSLIDWFYSIEQFTSLESYLRDGLDGWDGIHLSLTPPTTRAPLAVLKIFICQGWNSNYSARRITHCHYFVITIHKTRFENEVRSYCKSWTKLKVVKWG